MADGRDLARNEDFPQNAVIKNFFTVLKMKIQLSEGGVLRGKWVVVRGNFDVNRANQQFNTFIDM